MPTPASGKYIINKVAASGVPNFFAPQNDTELIQFARNEGATGANTGSAAAVLSWIATQPNLEAANFEYENIVTDGLVLNLDAGFVGSYPTINTTWYDLSGNNTPGSLINGPDFSSGSLGSFVFDGTNDKIGLGDRGQKNNLIFYSSSLTEFSAEVIFRIDGIASNPGSLSPGAQSLYRVDAWTKSELTYINSSSVLRFDVGYDTPIDVVSGSIALVTGSWYYATIVFKKTLRQEIYLNGTLYASKTPTVTGLYGGAANNQSTSDGSAFNLGMGHPAPYSTYFRGAIAMFRWYNRALSVDEILQNYNAQKSRFGL
jgi:hypothetical protein